MGPRGLEPTIYFFGVVEKVLYFVFSDSGGKKVFRSGGTKLPLNTALFPQKDVIFINSSLETSNHIFLLR